MILPFATKIDNWKTEFPEKIIKSLKSLELITNDIYEQLVITGAKNGLPFINDPFLAGDKLHTIRLDPKNRWQVGSKIHFVINNRTKNYYQFATVLDVKAVYQIKINPNTRRIYLNETELKPDVQNTLIDNDGFWWNHNVFWQYFNKPFEGKLIQWVPVSGHYDYKTNYLEIK